MAEEVKSPPGSPDPPRPKCLCGHPAADQMTALADRMKWAEINALVAPLMELKEGDP